MEVDYQKVNKIIPIPRIDDILDRLRQSKIFTALDLKCGYWQITMEENSVAKTAFTTPDIYRSD